MTKKMLNMSQKVILLYSYIFAVPWHVAAHSNARTIHSFCGQPNAMISSTNSFDLKAEGSPLVASANSVAGMANIVVLIASLSNSFVEVA